MRKLSLILLMALCLSSCIREEEASTPSKGFPEGKKVTVTFTVSGADLPDTKALGEDPDVQLNSLHLAVFGRSGYLKEYVQALPLGQIEDYTYTDLDGVSRTVPQYQFKADLTLTESPRIIHFIGNGPATLSFGYADAVLPVLMSQSGERAYWQMRRLSGIRARTKDGVFVDENDVPIAEGADYYPDAATLAALQEIPLIKNWSKIVVTSDTSEDPETHVPNDPYFTPKSYAVVNVPSRGSVAPHCATTNFVEGYQDYDFTELQDLGYTANLPVGTVFDTSVPSPDDFEYFTGGVAKANDPNSAVYLYERPVPSDDIPPTYVIIYGYYDNPNDQEHKGYYYYKVDLMVDAEYYPIFRNFKYQIVIHKILSQGHHSAAAAAAAAGSADVSADINARHLPDISDGVGRLAITPWMSHTYTTQQTDNQIFHAYFISNIDGDGPDMTTSSVTVEARPMPAGKTPLFSSVSIDPPSEDPDDYGWRKIHFSTQAPGTTIKTQTLRVTARHAYGVLYRDIEITVQPIQRLLVECKQKYVEDLKESPLEVDISIPDGLPQSMFPLVFKIEPERMTLTPDDNKANNNLPVQDGASISDDPDYAGKSSFHFLRTISWSEYRGLSTHMDDDDKTWRTFTCYFKTNRDESATTIWVVDDNADGNHYFYKNCDYFLNRSADNTFRKLKFNEPIPRQIGAAISASFAINDLYDGTYPEITIRNIVGIIPTDEGMVLGADGNYRFTPTASPVTLHFETVTDDGDVSFTLDAEDMEPKTLHSYYFTDVKIWDCYKLTTSAEKWSNTVFGHVNNDKGKTLLLGYHEDAEQLNTPVNLSLSRLNMYNGATLPITPTGPVTTGADPTYHEIHLETLKGSSVDNNPVSFTMSSPGYVEETRTYNRFQGNIYTAKIEKENIKQGNTVNFTPEHPTLSVADMDKKGVTLTIAISGATISQNADGTLLTGGASGTDYTMTASTDKYKLSFACILTDTNYEFTGTVTPDIGIAGQYPGEPANYYWIIQNNTVASSFATIHVPAGETMCIKGFWIKSANVTFQDQ